MYKKPTKTKEPRDEERAYEYAMFLLSLHLRTEGEVRQKLEGRGYTSDTVKTVIIRLMDQKYLDDQRYAEVFLENLKQYKSFGFYGIKKKFIEKKLPSSIIEKVLADGLTVEEEIKIAKRFLKKVGIVAKSETNLEPHYSNFNGVENQVKQKIAQKLKTKGFRGEVVARLIF
jgi:regulatory protein